MAIQSVVPACGHSLFLEPASHPNPQAIADAAEREAGSLMQEIQAVSELLFLAETNPHSQMNDDTVAYAAMVLRRLSRWKVELDELQGRASMAVLAERRAAA